LSLQFKEVDQPSYLVRRGPVNWALAALLPNISTSPPVASAPFTELTYNPISHTPGSGTLNWNGVVWDLPAIQKRTKNGGFRQERTFDNLPMSSPETSKIWSIAVQKHAAEQREKLMSIFQCSFRNAPLIQVEFHPNPFFKREGTD